MRRQPAPTRRFEVELSLLRAERVIRLLDRLVACNAGSERERLLRTLREKRPLQPAFAYRPRPNLLVLRRSLDELRTDLEQGDEFDTLYAERALELSQEAALVDAFETPEFVARARARFDPHLLAPAPEVRALAESWLLLATPSALLERVASDDANHPKSLINLLRERVGTLRLPVRIELRRGLGAVAAAGEDFVVVRPSVMLTLREAERIALHELEAHVLPRQRAAAEQSGLYRVGCRGSGEQEEGRALLIEERAGFFDETRRRELALRHRAAEAAHEGASFQQSVELLRNLGAGLEAALDISIRAQRGGGLGREIVYLPAYLHVRAAFAAESALERFFERGRLSVLGARLMMRLERAEPS